MSLKYFRCPDGDKVEVKECLEKCPQESGRCLGLPTLTEVANTRPWEGIPSTTQLLNPTRIEYLKITKDYCIDPFDRAFALLGTRHHQMLDVVAKKLEMISEKKLIGKISGILDLLEPDELCPESFKLIDYKTWGAYSIKKLLNNSGNLGDEGWNAKYQLNRYRLEVEKLGFPVSCMFVQCTVRDGGTQVARQQGIEKKMYFIKIARIDDGIITKYFNAKSNALLTALANKILPPICSYDERWGNKRCLKFCEVSSFCPEGAKINKVKLEV